MTKIQCSENVTSLLLSFPYELNAVFKNLFKTARWNAAQKAYEVKNTPQNRNKWKLFVEHSREATAALEAHDELEPSANELKKLCEELELVTKEATSKLQRAQEQIAMLSPERERLACQYGEVAAQLAEAEDKRAKLIAPVLELYRKHNFDNIILEYQSGARRGYSGKEKCSSAEDKLRLLRKELKLAGFVVKGMSELLDTSLNRSDKILERSEALARNKLTGIEIYIADET
jgi:chromosome segregation ATPase